MAKKELLTINSLRMVFMAANTCDLQRGVAEDKRSQGGQTIVGK